MAINLLVLLALMVYFGATMTLPGIAGFILTIGMGVDTNVLIFERIKEELLHAKGVKAAVAAGFDRVFLTILDTHVASLIAAAFLFQFGTGPIRGFAMTLCIGLLTNVFTSVFVSRTLFELALRDGTSDRSASRRRAGRSHADLQERQLRLHPMALARADAVIGDHHRRPRVQRCARRHAAGHRLHRRHDGRAPVPAAGAGTPVRKALDGLPGEKVVQQYGEPSAQRDPDPPAAEHSAEQRVRAGAGRSRRDRRRIQKADCGKFDVLSTEVVGPVIGEDLQRKGIYATLASIVGISVYIALRFRLTFALGAIVATFHDIFVVLAMMTSSATSSR